MLETSTEMISLKELLDKAWLPYLRDEKSEALNAFADVVNTLSIIPESTSKRKKDFVLPPTRILGLLCNYEHPQVSGINDESRKIFTLAIARSWLLARLDIKDGTYYRSIDPLAVIIGSDYTFNFDLKLIVEEVYGDDEYQNSGGSLYSDINLPIKYEERTILWPELTKLGGLSFSARKAFLCAIQYTQISSGLVEYERMNFFQSSLISSGLIELANSALIDINLGIKDLLMQLTLNDLRQYAFERGVASHGTKYQLAKLIEEELDPEIVRNYLRIKNSGTNFIRPIVSDLPLLKKYIWAEINRIDLYLHWLEKVYCLRIPPIRYSKEQLQRWKNAEIKRERRANMKQNYPGQLTLSHDERQLVRSIWDDNCDQIVRDLAEKYAWFIKDQGICLISDAVSKYLPQEILKDFKKRFEGIKSGCWNTALNNYGSERRYRMGIKLREPELLICNGCGIQFSESSIYGGIAKRVNFKIKFCSSCYGVACWHGDCAKPFELSETEMLDLLRNFCQKLETIPPIKFMKNPRLDIYDTEKQIEIVKHLLCMPSYKEYERIFGSWIKSLTLAGVLEDGVRVLTRGYQCIAKDGHICLSLSEKVIDDWLSAHNIKHDKEPLYPYDFYLNSSGRMRGDWKVNDLIIEYAGLLDDCPFAEKSG